MCFLDLVILIIIHNQDALLIQSISLFSEHTCFDGHLSSDHETDVDCGGEFCEPCNISQVSSMMYVLCNIEAYDHLSV